MLLLRYFLLLILWLTFSPPVFAANYSLRFYGNGVNDIDRVKIPVDNPQTAADVGAGDFTIEWWMKAQITDNNGYVSCGANDGWITGNTLFDRDIFFEGDYGDFGIALGSGVLGFGVNNGSTGTVLCGSHTVADGNWHHVAVTRRRSDGQLSMFVDGTLSARATGPGGDISYRNNRATTYSNDPYLVLGAEKHDAGSGYPSYTGELDEIRISNTIRYSTNFARPSAPFSLDTNTLVLYHLDEGSGTTTVDTAGNVNGTLKVGGTPGGPVYTLSTVPFGTISSPTPTTLIPSATSTKIPTPTPRAIPGDIDTSGRVDIQDLMLFITNFLSPQQQAIDADKNGIIDIFDYMTIVKNFGRTN